MESLLLASAPAAAPPFLCSAAAASGSVRSVLHAEALPQLVDLVACSSASCTLTAKAASLLEVRQRERSLESLQKLDYSGSWSRHDSSSNHSASLQIVLSRFEALESSSSVVTSLSFSPSINAVN